MASLQSCIQIRHAHCAVGGDNFSSLRNCLVINLFLHIDITKLISRTLYEYVVRKRKEAGILTRGNDLLDDLYRQVNLLFILAHTCC